jgi:hypothetical protein
MRLCAAISSCSICSSNSDGSTTAAMPAFSSRFRLSTEPVSGDADATMGCFSAIPR